MSFFVQKHRLKKAKKLADQLETTDLKTNLNDIFLKETENLYPPYQISKTYNEFESFNCESDVCQGCTSCLMKKIQNKLNKTPYQLAKYPRTFYLSPVNVLQKNGILSKSFDVFSKNYIYIQRRPFNYQNLDTKPTIHGKRLFYECDELAKNVSLLHENSLNSKNATDFAPEFPMKKIDDFIKRGKKCSFTSLRTLKNTFLHFYSDPIEFEYIPKHRVAAPGQAWPYLSTPGVLGEIFMSSSLPIFLYLRCPSFNFNTEARFASIFLFDVHAGVRLSETFSVDTLTTGLFRITPRRCNDGDDVTRVNSSYQQLFDGIYFVIQVDKWFHQGDNVENSGIDDSDVRILESPKKYATSSISPGLEESKDVGHRTPFAWTAIDFTLALAQAELNRIQLPDRCLHNSSCTQSREHHQSRSQRMVNVFKRTHKSSHRSGTVSSCERPSSDRFSPSASSIFGSDIYPPKAPSPGETLFSPSASQSCPSSFEEVVVERSRSDSGHDKESHILHLNIQTFFKQDSSGSDIGKVLTDLYNQKIASSKGSSSDLLSLDLQSFQPCNCSPWLSTVNSSQAHGNPLRKLKVISNLSMTLSIHLISANRLSSFLEGTERFISPEGWVYTSTKIPRKCSPESKSCSSSRGRLITCLQEVLEFPSIDRLFAFNTPRNLLYIYPNDLQFSGSRLSSGIILVTVQLWECGLSDMKIIPAFYGNPGSNKLLAERKLKLIFSNNSFKLCDEIKLQLPYLITENNYLLFTFTKVLSASTKVERNPNKYTVLGYTWLPLLRDGLIYSGKDRLCLIKDMPSFNVMKTVPIPTDAHRQALLENTRLVDLGKTTFQPILVPVSSLYQTEPATHTIIDACSPSNLMKTIKSLSKCSCFSTLLPSALVSSITNSNCQSQHCDSPLLTAIRQASINELVLYLGPLLDGLLRVLGVILTMPSESEKADHNLTTVGSENMFNLIAILVLRVKTYMPEWSEHETGRNRLFIAYLSGTSGLTPEQALPYLLAGFPHFGLTWTNDVATFITGNGKKTSNLLHKELLRLLLSVTSGKSPFLDFFFREADWFFFEILVRTMIVEQVNDADKEYLDLMHSLTVMMVGQIVSLTTMGKSCTDSASETMDNCGAIQWNRSLAFFLYDCLGCMNTSIVFRQISTYLRMMNNSISDILKSENSSHDGREHSTNLISSLRASTLQQLEILKLEFLSIVSSAEDYTVINLPRQELLSESNFHLIIEHSFLKSLEHGASILTNPGYRTIHFLPAAILSEVKICLDSRDTFLQKRALALLWYQFRNHASNECLVLSQSTDNDDITLSDVSCLYLPLLEIATDLVPSLYTHWLIGIERESLLQQEMDKVASLLDKQMGSPAQLGHSSLELALHSLSSSPVSSKWNVWNSSSTNPKEGISRKSHRTLAYVLTEDQDTCLSPQLTPTNPNGGLHSLGGSLGDNQWLLDLLPAFPFFGSETAFSKNELDALHRGSVKRLLIETLWVLHHTEVPLVEQWIWQGGCQRIPRILALLILALDYFEYKRQQLHQADDDTVSSKAATSILKQELMETTGICKSCNAPENCSVVDDRNELVNARMHQLSKAIRDCREKSKILANTVTSIVCNTLENIIMVIERRYSTGERTDSTINSQSHSRILEMLARTYLYGLSRHQCAISFRVLCCGLSTLIEKFPAFFLNENPVVLFAYCRLLLPFCSSSLPKIRAIAVAAFYHLFQCAFALNKHLFPLSGAMTLALHIHLYPEHSFLDTSSSWIHSKLGAIGKSLDFLKKPQALIRRNIFPENEFHRRRLSSTSNPFLDIRSTIQAVFIPFLLRSLNVYARMEGKLTEDESVFSTRSDHLSGVGYIVYNAKMYSATEFHIQLAAVVETWQEMFKSVCELHELHQNIEEMSEQEDLLSLVDNIIRLAETCRFVPELRQHWLLRLAECHLFVRQPCEAAQCLSHALALAVEQFVNRKTASTLFASSPLEGASSIAEYLTNINLFEECSVETAIGLPISEPCYRYFRPVNNSSSTTLETEDRQHSSDMVVSQLSQLVDKAASCFMSAEQYEFIPPLCHWLLPLLSAVGQHERLSSMHTCIRDAHALISDPSIMRRLFSTYFRVGFYGSLFERLDGQEYIYKEPPLTKLSEITARLQNFYANKIGEERLVMLKDSKMIQKNFLDNTLAYIQITYVEPYFLEYELRRRKSQFQRNCGIKRFALVTPFTRDGRARGSLSEQFKRKTILTTFRSFPYLTTRLKVVNREEIISTPIQVALEDVSNRNDQLDQALAYDPPDVKILQMVLQGCVGATVNQGPLEIASTFLTKDDSTEVIPKDPTLCATNDLPRVKNELRLCLKEFLRKSYEAVCLNRQLIGQDQTEYQREIERNFNQIKQQMDPFLQPQESIRQMLF